MGLSNYQLVLLDNLIYLDTIVMYGREKGNYTIRKDDLKNKRFDKCWFMTQSL